jgi:hypothetical protein
MEPMDLFLVLLLISQVYLLIGCALVIRYCREIATIHKESNKPLFYSLAQTYLSLIVFWPMADWAAADEIRRNNKRAERIVKDKRNAGLNPFEEWATRNGLVLCYSLRGEGVPIPMIPFDDDHAAARICKQACEKNGFRVELIRLDGEWIVREISDV